MHNGSVSRVQFTPLSQPPASQAMALAMAKSPQQQGPAGPIPGNTGVEYRMKFAPVLQGQYRGPPLYTGGVIAIPGAMGRTTTREVRLQRENRV